MIIKSLVAMILIFFCHALWASIPKEAKFISVADIHFDPFSGCKKSHISCVLVTKLNQANYQEWSLIFEQFGDNTPANFFQDTNYALLKTFMNKLKKVNQKEKPQFIIILGDFLSHHFHKKYVEYSGDKTQKGYQAFVKKTLQFLTNEFSQQFPTIDVFPVVGNNDSYTGNYGVVPHGLFFQDTTDTWSVLIKNKENRDSFRQDFPIAGYYVVTLPKSENQKLIVLNSVLFSSHIHNSIVTKAAKIQLQWLQKQLRLAADKHENVIIAEHIPLGMDVFATMKTKFQHVKQFWQPVYAKQFKDELSHFKAVIGILSGHIHVEAFQLMMENKIENTPVYFTPSVSPIYGNNPGFKIYKYIQQPFSMESSVKFIP